MESDPLLVNLTQPALFELGDTSQGMLEIFPAVWNAAQSLISPDASIRRSGLEKLNELGAVRLSPLVAYLVATRITDEDYSLRAQVIEILGNVLKPDQAGRVAPEEVRQQLSAHLGQMRTRQVYALLQAADLNPACRESIAHLLYYSPEAGTHLVTVLNDRKAPLPIRSQAIYFVGQVGYLDAISGLERLQGRLEARLAGQQALPFYPPDEHDESQLLPAVLEALQMLKSP